ncbi:TPA: hypothetical protein ACH3X1_002547 [Trebouxia sp. C0004]
MPRICKTACNIVILNHVILNHVRSVSLLGQAVAPSDKTGFWSHIMQNAAGLQPLKSITQGRSMRTARHLLPDLLAQKRTSTNVVQSPQLSVQGKGPFPKVHLVKTHFSSWT